MPALTEKCPRIYNQFEAPDGRSIDFQFKSPFHSLYALCPLLFRATANLTEASSETEEVLVKIVEGDYGYEAHRIAAESGFAPKLYGVAKLDGAPSAYIMEFLSEKSGWEPLRYLFSRLSTPSHFEKLGVEIDKFRSLLEKHNLVHGDLRANNTLVRVQGESVELRVLDWNWAGAQGIVRYPLDLNPAAGLPGQPGDLIWSAHDHSSLIKLFNQVKQEYLRSRKLRRAAT